MSDESSKSDIYWFLRQSNLKIDNLKYAEDVLRMIHEKNTDDGTISQTYICFVECPSCSKKVDCMMWNGVEYYFEVDLNAERLSPIHWCDLTDNFQLDDFTQIVVNTFEKELQAMRKLV